MKLIELFDIIKNTAIENSLSTPYVVGGFVRDILLKKVDEVKDIDITCGDNGSLLLGQKLVKKLPGSKLITFNDGHSRLSYQNLSLDFSNNFIVSGIDKILKEKGVFNKKEIYKEMYSRDFTMNALLLPIDMSTILDITTKGIKDIADKIIDTCLDPQITFGSDPKRILRVIYLCAKLGFKPSKRVANWILKNGNLISKVNSKYIKGRINAAISYNKDYTIKLLKELNLTQYIPETEELRNALFGV